MEEMLVLPDSYVFVCSVCQNTSAFGCLTFSLYNSHCVSVNVYFHASL